jgi:uncharacterized SAM-binding protein YcdF (DUF218 family)
MGDAHQIVQTLEEMGVPEQRLGGEECSQTTHENALFTSALLHSQGIRKIILVTDSPHMLRSLLTFRSFGFHVIPHPSPQSTHYSLRNKIGNLLREYAGLAIYALSGQFSPHPVAVLNDPPAEVARKILDWSCQEEF